MGKGNGKSSNPLRELPSHQDSRDALENGRNVLIACERITNAQRQSSLLDDYDTVTRSYEQTKLL